MMHLEELHELYLMALLEHMKFYVPVLGEWCNCDYCMWHMRTEIYEMDGRG
ncbi:MAG: hypothetical protein PHU49_15085 [Syntrophorhabdaceae bacterium]|nr:hypothetical protein [Syntrophorhabdaceae bacterium]